MQQQDYTVEVTVRVTRPEGYNTVELAAATVKDRAPWDELKPTASRRALDGVLEDAVSRVERQLKTEHLRRIEQERAEAETAEREQVA